MDYIFHGVTKSWTQLNDFHFHSREQSVLQLEIFSVALTA